MFPHPEIGQKKSPPPKKLEAYVFECSMFTDLSPYYVYVSYGILWGANPGLAG